MPFLTNLLTISTTWLDGIAKPIPSTVVPEEDVDSFIELIPTICPAKLIKGPPELPGLIAASV
ncbi:hypothetical protein GCM10025879_12790 [Leuconostoc litchii]|nr:hypothetical protein GCM10025879_12790 [Leuconostoc litchii]